MMRPRRFVSTDSVTPTAESRKTGATASWMACAMSWGRSMPPPWPGPGIASTCDDDVRAAVGELDELHEAGHAGSTRGLERRLDVVLVSDGARLREAQEGGACGECQESFHDDVPRLRGMRNAKCEP